MNAPLSPTVPNKKKRKRRGIARWRERAEGTDGTDGSFFFNVSGDEAGPFDPYVPTCGPFPRAVRFDVVFFKAVFTELARGPLARLFSSPKMAETIQHGRTRLFFLPPFFSLFISLVFPFFFSTSESPVGERCAFSGAFQSQTNLLWRLRLGVHPPQSTRARASVSFERCRNIFV